MTHCHFLRTTFSLSALWFVSALPAGPSSGAERAEPPRPIATGPVIRPVVLPDGTLQSFLPDRRQQQMLSVRSSDHGQTWSPPRPEFSLPLDGMAGGLAAIDRDGEIHVVLTHARGQGAPAVTRFIDLWHCHTAGGRRSWSPPQRIWEGYCGAVMDIKQLRSGRIIIPFAAWKKPGEEVAPSTGLNYTTCLYSDDGGRSWSLSPAKLTSPCTEGYNGNNYGAIEPTILELQDGRVWMLLRTQTGYLYESFSRDGVHWSPAKPSVFRSSSSPAALERFPDGRIVVVWNNCQMPPRHQGAGVYGGRDALHAAVSADEGATWRGFREVYRDPFRNQTPPRRGDRGTAYPGMAAAQDGTLVLVTGQGNRRTMLLVDPEWLLERAQEEDFSKDLSAWHVWKEFGPAAGYWRDRTQGPRLVPHPSRAGAQALLVCKPDGNDADCAAWNFPAAARGRLSLRMLLPAGSAGAIISLTDRFFHPGDERGEAEAVFRLTVRAAPATDGDIRLPAGRWSTVTLTWDTRERTCQMALDDSSAGSVPLQNQAAHGPSYLRVRSAAEAEDPHGVLVDWVAFEAEQDE